jgi:iron(III) transport system ATP-binding protein
MVEIKDVSKSYGTSQVVKGLSLSVGVGELVAFLGPSGCGKTTTLRMIAGLERLDGGVIALDGQVVDSAQTFVPPEMRGLGMVFQSYAVWPHRSVFDNIAYPLKLKGLPHTEVSRQVGEALEWVRLTPYATRMPGQLSGGQLQRVAIARALVAKPRVLLLDEPLSNLDAALRDELRGEIASLRARLGITMIFVTHDQHEALSIASRVAVMNAGRIEQVDRPEVIYHQPATPFVAGFVGGANVLDGVIAEREFISEDVHFALPDGLVAPSGPVKLVVRPEDVRVAEGEQGTPLTLLARLFLGKGAEYRFSLPSGRSLRAVDRVLEARAGEVLRVSLTQVRLYPNPL